MKRRERSVRMAESLRTKSERERERGVRMAEWGWVFIL